VRGKGSLAGVFHYKEVKMSQDKSGPAFPLHPNLAPALGCVNSVSDAGMSVRDYFAAKVLQGIYAHTGGYPPEWADGDDDLVVAERCYEMADAMLEVRLR
jgi:hypothetical protein